MPVYFLRAGEHGPVKIGVADDVAGRQRELQCGNHEILTLLRAVDGGRAHEAWLHRQFVRVRGEWFQFDERMLTIEPPQMSTEQDFRRLLDQWPTRRAIAEDCEVPYVNAQMWATRNAVPARHFLGLIAGAKRRGIEGVTLEFLYALLSNSRNQAA
jgi:hypothetical protein